MYVCMYLFIYFLSHCALNVTPCWLIFVSNTIKCTNVQNWSAGSGLIGDKFIRTQHLDCVSAAMFDIIYIYIHLFTSYHILFVWLTYPYLLGIRSGQCPHCHILGPSMHATVVMLLYVLLVLLWHALRTQGGHGLGAVSGGYFGQVNTILPSTIRLAMMLCRPGAWARMDRLRRGFAWRICSWLYALCVWGWCATPGTLCALSRVALSLPGEADGRGVGTFALGVGPVSI